MTRMGNVKRESKLVVARGCEGKWGVTANGYRFLVRGDGNVPELDSGDSCTTL